MPTGRARTHGGRLFVDDHRLRVTVEDEGIGLPDTSPDPAHGIGVSVIRALTEDVRFRARPGGGTEVEMEFSAHRQEQPLLQIPAAAAPDDDLLPERDGELVISLSPVTLLAGVLGRLARTWPRPLISRWTASPTSTWSPTRSPPTPSGRPPALG